MEPLELIEKLKEENTKLRESNFKLTANLYKYADLVVELQKDVTKKLDTNSRLREENQQLKIEFEKLFDNWALGNFDTDRFFSEFQIMIHKIQQ